MIKTSVRYLSTIIIRLLFQLLFARGELVELLISSNIARYAEFRAVSRVATYMDGKLTQVPCSRADVFANKTVSVVEKRMLMQLLTSCMEQGADSPEFNGKTGVFAVQWSAKADTKRPFTRMTQWHSIITIN